MTEYLPLDDDYYSKNSYQWALEKAGAKVLAFEAFGCYQGSWIAKVEHDGKQGWIRDYYGSCSGCDAFEGELHSDYDDNYNSLGYRKDAVVAFAKRYLDDIKSYDEVFKDVSANADWDTEAEVAVEFMKKNHAPKTGE